MDERTALLSEYQNVVAVLERLRAHMRRCGEQLREGEYRLLRRVTRQDITLLNPATRKLHVVFMELMYATLQLECKMGRRGLFALCARERGLLVRVEQLKARASELGIELPSESASASAREETSHAVPNDSAA